MAAGGDEVGWKDSSGVGLGKPDELDALGWSEGVGDCIIAWLVCRKKSVE